MRWTPNAPGSSPRSGSSPAGRSRPTSGCAAILDEAARIGAGIVRSLVFAPRDPDAYYYPDSTWATAFIGGSHEFLANGARLLDARAMMHYVGTGITPAMTHAAVGVGSQYAFTARDADGAWLDGGRDYTLTLPGRDPRQDLLGDRHL